MKKVNLAINIAVIVIIIVLIVLASVFLIPRKSDVELLELSKSSGDLEYCKRIKDSFIRIACFSKAYESDECMYLTALNKTQESARCYSNLALEEKDITGCYLINTPEGKDSCKETFYEMVVAEDNIELCQDNNHCIMFFAKAKNDISICNILEDENGIIACTRVVTGETEE